jgi:hypothetical protein
MQKELLNVDLGALVLGENPRIPNLEYIEELSEDISANGLKTPLITTPIDKTQFRILQGTRRFKALVRILENNPARFEEILSEGIPCNVMTDVTEEEMVDLIIDHGQIQGLTDPMELQLAANMLFRANKTERQVVVSLAGLLEKFTPMKKDVRKEWLDKLDRVKAAREHDPEWALQMQNEAEILLFNTRRGKIQNIHNAYRCPDVVMQALWLKATGAYHTNTPEDLIKSMPRTLTYAHVGQLYKSHKADIEADETNEVSKANPGVQFWAKWNEIVEKLRKEALNKADGKVRAKAMSATDMMQDFDERVWKSQGFLSLTQFHAGKGEVTKEPLLALDTIASAAEIVSDGAPDVWADVVKTADAIIKERAAANREKAAAAKVVKTRKKARK